MLALELAQVVVSSVATICMIGLGFLYRPGRATALWSLAFVVVMVTSYAAMVAVSSESDVLRLVSMSILLAAPALIWSGLRAHRGARPHEWIALLLAISAMTLLLLTAGTDGYTWAFRAAFAATAVFAGLAIPELLRLPERGAGTAFPLSVFSLVVPAVAIVSLVAGLFGSPGDADPLAFLRTVNTLGMLAYIVCALVTLLFIARGGDTGARRTVFHDVAADRLERAQAAGERSWSILYIELDDAADLRAIAGDAGFATITARLQTDIRETFPTEADIGRLDPSTFAVLVAQPSSVLRDRVRTVLRTVTAPHDAIDVGTSASIGWASVAEHGYDPDVLLDAARAAALRAASAGGDRWERSVS